VLGEDFHVILTAARTRAEWAWGSLYRDLAPSVLGYLRARGAGEPKDLTGEMRGSIERRGRGKGASRSHDLEDGEERLNRG
jgi:hypothetical protein